MQNKKEIPTWIDSHCHLEMCDGTSQSVLKTARDMGVRSVVSIGTKRESNHIVLKLSKETGIYGALGIHPHYAKDCVDEDFDFIEHHLGRHMKLVALGECGLDYHHEISPPRIQRRVFERQMDLSSRLRLPVIIHSRKAENDTIHIMEPYVKKGLRAILHSFTSNQYLADFGLRYDLYFSFNGICTFKKSEAIRETLRKVPLNRILLETDAPYISPEPYRGKRNHPGNVSVIGSFVSELLGIPQDEFALLISKNTQEFYSRIHYEN